MLLFSIHNFVLHRFVVCYLAACPGSTGHAEKLFEGGRVYLFPYAACQSKKQDRG